MWVRVPSFREFIDRVAHERWVRFWTVVSGVVGVLGLLVTVVVLFSNGSATSTSAGAPTSQSTSQEPTIAPTSLVPPVNLPSVNDSPSPSPSASSSDAALDPDPLFLSDVPGGQFVRTSFDVARTSARIGGKEYPSSYWYEFFNCTNCTSIDEFNISPVYRHFVGVAGLTDSSRHDNIIDGVEHFSIYANGKLVFGPTRVEYPAAISFDVDVSGASRIRLVVADGTNDEYACWCGAHFTK